MVMKLCSFHQGLCAVIKKRPALWLAFLVLGTTPVMACDLKVSDAWIREAPPGLMTLGGYASLENDSKELLQIVKLWSPAFAEVQMHQSVVKNGIASMHEIDKLEIPAHQRVVFAPSGKHFMLMGAQQALKKGDAVEVSFQDQHGCVTTTKFKIRGMGE